MMRRGDVVVAAMARDYGKPRPALVVQSDLFDGIPSVTVLPITSELHDLPLVRIGIDAAPRIGLVSSSQIMIDKIVTLHRRKISRVIGTVDDATLCQVEARLAEFLGLNMPSNS